VEGDEAGVLATQAFHKCSCNEGKVVEADETYTGNKGRNKARRKDGARAGADQWKVVSLVERGGKARSKHVDFLTANAVRHVLVTNVDRKSDLMTDQANVYKGVGTEFASHDTVNHSMNEWARGLVHTNTIEGFFSIFKRGMRGVYQHCGEHHLHRYLAEFDFRYSYRGSSWATAVAVKRHRRKPRKC
jgi:hypothetical protein